MTTQTTVSDLKINKLTSAQYATITPSATELYFITDDSGITSSDIVTALGYTPTQKIVETNGALTTSGGVCTWTVSHNMNNSNVAIHLYEVSSGEEVMFDRAITSANVVTIKILSASNISADTYKVVVLG